MLEPLNLVPPRPRRAARGLTLVELMIGVAVLGVLVAVAIPSLSDLLERRRVMAVGLEVANVLTTARAEANGSGDKISVHAEPDPSGALSCVSVNVQHIFENECRCYNPANALCPGTGVAVLRLFQIPNDKGVSFRANATSWGAFPYRISFARNQYYDFHDFNIVVTGRRTGAQVKVELNEANRVRVCSPGGSLGGIPAC